MSDAHRKVAGTGPEPEERQAQLEQAFRWLQAMHREAIRRRQLYGPGGCQVTPLEPGFGEASMPPSAGSALVRRLAALVMAHEGGYDAVNRNSDGAGASVGIFQWAQRTGGLGLLLREYQRADAVLFAQVFGPHWRALLQATAARHMGPVGGQVLWQDPWVSRFQQAGRQPIFQAVQDRLAREGAFMRAAFSAAAALGFTTERSLAMTLDTAVTQGPELARQVAWRVRRAYAGKTVPMKEVLNSYLHAAVARFHRTTPPTAPPSSPHLAWRPVGPEWHLHAGRVNLYRNILVRRGRLLSDPQLSDQPLDAGAANV